MEQKLVQVIDALVADKALGASLSAPSISHGSENLYMRGVLEEMTRENLSKVRHKFSDKIASKLMEMFRLDNHAPQVGEGHAMRVNEECALHHVQACEEIMRCAGDRGFSGRRGRHTGQRQEAAVNDARQAEVL